MSAATLTWAAPRRWIVGATALVVATVVALALALAALLVALGDDAPTTAVAPASTATAAVPTAPSLLDGCVVGRPC